MISLKSKKKEVEDFLDKLREILGKEDFDIDSDFVLIRKKKKDDEEHSTTFTILDLDYDTQDVINRLKELTVKEYSETRLDMDDNNPPMLFIFGKDINNKLVYIKLKIRNGTSGKVLCVSFHYAKEKMLFPYA